MRSHTLIGQFSTQGACVRLVLPWQLSKHYNRLPYPPCFSVPQALFPT